MFYYSQNDFMEFMKLLYTFLVTSFAQYREYIICLISFSKFSDLLPASAIGNIWSICLGVNILKPSAYFVLYLASDTVLE